MHDVIFLRQAQPTLLGAGLVGGGPRQELPLDVEVIPLDQASVLELPDVARQPRVLSLRRVLKVGLVVSQPALPGGADMPTYPCFSFPMAVTSAW